MSSTAAGFREKSFFGYKVDYSAVSAYQDFSKFQTNESGYMYYNPSTETWEVATSFPFTGGVIGSVVFRGATDELSGVSDLHYTSSVLYAPNMHTSSISGLSPPTLPNHAATKDYVDSVSSSSTTTFWRQREGGSNNLLFSYTPDGVSMVDVVEVEVPP